MKGWIFSDETIQNRAVSSHSRTGAGVDFRWKFRGFRAKELASTGLSIVVGCHTAYILMIIVIIVDGVEDH